jgi:hypothetical protein
MFQKNLYLIINIITLCNIYQNINGMQNQPDLSPKEARNKAQETYWNKKTEHQDKKYQQNTEIRYKQINKLDQEINKMSTANKIVEGLIEASTTSLANITTNIATHTTKKLLDYWLAGLITEEEYIALLNKRLEHLKIYKDGRVNHYQLKLPQAATQEQIDAHNAAYFKELDDIGKIEEETHQAFLKTIR